MLYQCNYAARVREKVAKKVFWRELGALSLLYQLSRARIGLYVVLVQVSDTRRQPEVKLVLRPQLGRLDRPIPVVTHCICPWFRDRRPRNPGSDPVARRPD